MEAQSTSTSSPLNKNDDNVYDNNLIQNNNNNNNSPNITSEDAGYFANIPLPYCKFSVNNSTTVRTQPIKAIDAQEQALFADEIWPGAVRCSELLKKFPHICNNKYILELGAGAALPSLVALALGAERVVITDYPNERLLNNIKKIVLENKFKLEEQAYVREHAWGTDVRELKDLSREGSGFDLILLCESFWSATYNLHRQLLTSLYNCLSIYGVAIVSFTHHITDDHPPERDLEFFHLAMAGGFLVEVYNDSTSEQEEGNNDNKKEDSLQHLFLLRKRPLNLQQQQQLNLQAAINSLCSFSNATNNESQ